MEFISDTMVAAALPLVFFAVALLYSSVGHGGASGYLAVMALLSFPAAQASTTALILNTLVSGIAFVAFRREGHFSFRIAWPFLIGSVPAALVGGLLHVPRAIYSLLLGVVLLFMVIRLIVSITPEEDGDQAPLPRAGAIGIGSIIGVVSGVVGVGGGIFLSPIMLFFRWAHAKQTAAVSACFVLVNSIAGLAGRAVDGSLVVADTTPLILAALLGGLVGSHLGSRIFSGLAIRRLLATVVLIASWKLFATALV